MRFRRENRYKGGRQTRLDIRKVVCLSITTMRSSLFLLALAAANGVTAGWIPSANYLNKPGSVASYLDSLVPVAKDVLQNQIGGPSIGADVSPNYLSFCTSCARC
jgi:hypothetical protein